MTSRKLASAVAAASLAGGAVLGMSTPAVAQSYPPATTERGISDSTVQAGQDFEVSTGSGACDPGTDVLVEIPGLDGEEIVEADETGNATIALVIEAGAPLGNYEVVFTCELEGDLNEVRVPFTLVSGTAPSTPPGTGTPSVGTPGGTAGGGTSLPRTGADQMVPLAITGIALVGVGAGIVAASRRRREDMPAGIA